MRIGKLFHLTPLVDDLAAAEAFFLSVFGPWCTARGYSPHWHRNAAMLVIADTLFEPLQPLAPGPGDEPTSWYRYLAKHGPRVLNMAFYVDDAPELEKRLNEAGVRTTDGRWPNVVFSHPKDTPGMLEFLQQREEMNDPRLLPGYQALRDRYWRSRHPLGLRRLSHLTVAVSDRAAARDFYSGVLEAVTLPEQESSFAETESHHVLLGEDTVLELAQPSSERSPLAADLGHAGEHVVAATFLVEDLDRAARHLELVSAPVASNEGGRLVLDHRRTWGLRYHFSDRALAGDRRPRGDSGDRA